MITKQYFEYSFGLWQCPVLPTDFSSHLGTSSTVAVTLVFQSGHWLPSARFPSLLHLHIFTYWTVYPYIPIDMQSMPWAGHLECSMIFRLLLKLFWHWKTHGVLLGWPQCPCDPPPLLPIPCPFKQYPLFDAIVAQASLPVFSATYGHSVKISGKF